MTLLDRLQFFTVLDLVAVGAIAVAWLGIGYAVEHARGRRPSVSILMERYRQEWLRAFITRNPRVFDTITLGNLRQGTAFFASTCLIAIGGGLALIGNTEQLLGVAEDLSLEAPEVVWEVKILLVLLFLANALFKFIWAHRLFGYSAVVMAAAPNDETDIAYHRAAQSADITNSAARSFNRGLRALYFALGAAAWLLGPVALLAATLVTTYTIWSREFRSHSREVLLRKGSE